MITLFCLCAAIWAQRNDKDVRWWGLGAAFFWPIDLAAISIIVEAIQ